MEENKKKTVMVIIIVVCLVVAGVIAFMNLSGGSGGLSTLKGQMMWVKCSNPDCGATYEMDKEEFYEYLRDHDDPINILQIPAFVCNECGKESIYKATKCKCGNIFFDGEAGDNTYFDKCPKCSYSKFEERRKQAKKK